MKQVSKHISRRCFFQGCALTAAGFSIDNTLSYFSFEKMPAEEASKHAQVVIYQDKAHFDNSGLLEAYKAPVNLASSTRKYVDAVDSQTFLSRHWFV